MNKYRDKSDFEINKEVVKLIKTKGGYSCVDYDEIVKVYVSQNTGIYKEFDPCNDPYDAMPIVLGNRIDIRLMGCSEGNKRYWVEYAATAFDETDDGEIITVFTSPNKNIYRAAMEVFLMMKDAENEKV